MFATHLPPANRRVSFDSPAMPGLSAPKRGHAEFRRAAGFTLIEIMVVVVILGILAAVIVPRLAQEPEKARTAKAKQDIRVLESALERYKLDSFYYPSTQQGLEALVQRPEGDPPAKNWQGPYLKQLNKDPWGNPYQYMNPGAHGDFDLFTLGADGKPGGEGPDADVGNWNMDNS